MSAVHVPFGETPIGFGATLDGNMLEILVSPKGTWTALITSPAGLGCMVAVGQNWEQQAAPIEGKDA